MGISDAKKRATNKYRATKDLVNVYFPAGTAAAVRSQGVSVSGLCNDLVREWLRARGIEDVSIYIVDKGARAGTDPVRGDDLVQGSEPVQMADNTPGASVGASVAPVAVSGGVSGNIVDLSLDMGAGHDLAGVGASGVLSTGTGAGAVSGTGAGAPVGCDPVRDASVRGSSSGAGDPVGASASGGVSGTSDGRISPRVIDLDSFI